jgi:hypothetical protein
MKVFGRLGAAVAVMAALAVGMMDCDGNGGTGPGGGGTAPKITTSTLPGGTAGTPYSQTLKASGDAPVTWSLESGALPPGLNLLGSGTISGTPTTAGTYSFSVKAFNSAGNDVSSFSITITGGSTTPPITPTTQSIDGIWEHSNGERYTVNGSTGVITVIGSVSALGQSAIDKGYLKTNTTVWRNLTSTGNSTWSGQKLMITFNTSNPNVATGTTWDNCTFTISADGQKLTVKDNDNNGNTVTYTRSGNSINGVWEHSNGERYTVNGSTGVITVIGSVSALGQSAIDKGYLKTNTTVWRNLTSTGNSTWSGQKLMITFNTSNPNVATGTTWDNCTFTISVDGQKLTVKDNDNNGDTVTYTRKQ